MDFGTILHLKEISFIPGLKKNLLLVSSLEDKGFKVAFMDGKDPLWQKDSDISSSEVIVVQEGGLYKLSSHPIQGFVHDTINLYELWHHMFGHI